MFVDGQHVLHDGHLDGEEHIVADVAYAVDHYLRWTDDRDFLTEQGAEMSIDYSKGAELLEAYGRAWESFDGDAWVGITPFRVGGLRLRALRRLRALDRKFSTAMGSSMTSTASFR